MTKALGHGGGETIPLAREDAPHPLGDPLDLAARRGGHESQHEGLDPPGVRLGVGQGERRPPRQAEDHPALDPEELPQGFDIGNQVGRGVGAQIGAGFTRQGPTAPCPALIEQHGTVAFRIEEAPLPR